MPLVLRAAAGLEAELVQDLLHRDLAAEGVEVHACHDLVHGLLIETTDIPYSARWKIERRISLLTSAEGSVRPRIPPQPEALSQ